MPSWILIPIYLVKNTLHRWWENLASPATKVLVPFLISSLALLVLGFLKTIENGLSDQLTRDDLRAIQLSEGFYGDEAGEAVQVIASDRVLWGPYTATYESFQRIPISVETRWMRQTPVLVYDRELSFLSLPESPAGEPREIFMLLNQNVVNQKESILFQSIPMTVQVQRMPEIVAEVFGGKAMIMVPIEVVDEVLPTGFVQMQRLIPKREINPGALEAKIRTFANLEDRQIQIVSSVSILERLELLLEGQQTARWALGGVVTLILSLILASLSLLEFRQEAYLVALLRSFGIRAGALLLHVFLESCVLTYLGVGLGILAIERLFPVIIASLTEISDETGLTIPELAVASHADLKLLFISATVGIVLATIPVMLGMRKRPGLVLS